MALIVTIRPADSGDATSIAAIYNYYISNTVVTFEEAEVTAIEIAERLNETLSQKLPYLVAERDGQILGFAYASKWKGRCAYRYSVETTVYLAPDKTGGGVGSRLYADLFQRLAKLGYRTAIGGISLPNAGSIALHEKFGMEKVAHFKEVGYKFEDWVDVGYWQGLIEPVQSA